MNFRFTRRSSLLLFLPLALLVLMLGAGCNKTGSTDTDPPPGANWVRLNVSNSHIASNNLTSVFVDAEGSVWFGSDSGVSNLRNSNWTNLRDSLSYPVRSGLGYTVNGIGQNKDGSLWFGTQGGLVRFNKNSARSVWTRYKVPPIPVLNVNSVVGELTSFGELWVTTGVAGAARFIPSQTTPDEGTWTQFNSGNSPLTNQLASSAVSPLDGKFWFGTADAGIFSHDPGSGLWNQYPLPAEQARNVTSIALDLNGLAWCAKRDSGVSVLEIGTGVWLHHYTINNTHGLFPRGAFHAVTTDLRKHRWFGTDDGLIELNDTVWTMHSFRDNPVIPNDPITALAYDPKGNLWIATMDSGAVCYNPNGTRF